MPFASFSHKRVWSFDQSVSMDAVNNSCNAAHQGSCHNFSLEWLTTLIQQKASGSKGAVSSGMNKRESHMKMARTVKSAIVTQTAFGKAWGDLNYENADGMMAKLRQLKVTTVIKPAVFSAAAVEKRVNKSGRAGYVYSFWFAGGGGHSIAFYRSGGTGALSGGHVWAYDPNLGEFKMKPKEFSDWLGRFIAHYQQYFPQVAKHAMKQAAAQKFSLSGVR